MPAAFQVLCGAGMAALTAMAVVAHRGFNPTILEPICISYSPRVTRYKVMFSVYI